MFTINFRVFDEDFEEMRTASLTTLNKEFDVLYGFFQIQAGEEEHGYYYDGLIQEGECVPEEDITVWFEFLLEMVALLDRQDGCVMVRSIDDYDVWITFDKSQDEVKVSCIVSHDNVKAVHLCTGDEVIEKVFWSVPNLEWLQVRDEVVSKGKKLIQEMEALNSRILKSTALRRIVELVYGKPVGKRKVNTLQSFFLMHFLLFRCLWLTQEKDLLELVNAMELDLGGIWMPVDEAMLQVWSRFRFATTDKAEIKESVLAFLEMFQNESGYSLHKTIEYVQDCTDEAVRLAVRDMDNIYGFARKVNSEYFRKVTDGEKVEHWVKVYQGRIPKKKYFCEVTNGETGLMITLRAVNGKVTLDFGLALGMRMYKEGYVLNGLPQVEETGQDYRNIIYRVYDGDLLKDIEEKSGEVYGDEEVYQFAIVTTNYFIEVVTQWEPVIMFDFRTGNFAEEEPAPKFSWHTLRSKWTQVRDKVLSKTKKRKII